MESNEVTVCHESEADQWSLYERHPPDNLGFSQSVWVADFARQTDALVFIELLNRNFDL